MSVGEMSFAIIWPILSIITFIATLVVNYLAAIGLLSDKTVSDVSKDHELMITPSNWTFSIWAIIYVWQFLWISQILYLCCRHDMRQIIIGPIFYISFIISNLLNIAWIITWCNNCIVIAGILLTLTTICLYICMITANSYIMIKANNNYVYYAYDDDIPHWLNEGIIGWLVVTVLNGVSFYAQWVLIASCINFGVIFKYKADIMDETASFITLGILSIFLIAYFALDFSRKFGKVLRFTFSPYFVLIIAFCGMITKHGIDPHEYPPSIMALILLILTCIACGLKVYSSIFVSRISPSWDDQFLSDSF